MKFLFKFLFKILKPVICLQETLITQNDQFKFNHYNNYQTAATTNDKAHGDVGLIEKNDIPQQKSTLTLTSKQKLSQSRFIKQ